MPSIGSALRNARDTLKLSEREAASRLLISPGHLADIENGRVGVNLARAARFATRLGLKKGHFVQAALQACVDEARLPFTVTLTRTHSPNPLEIQKITPQTGKR